MSNYRNVLVAKKYTFMDWMVTKELKKLEFNSYSYMEIIRKIPNYNRIKMFKDIDDIIDYNIENTIFHESEFGAYDIAYDNNGDLDENYIDLRKNRMLCDVNRYFQLIFDNNINMIAEYDNFANMMDYIIMIYHKLRIYKINVLINPDIINLKENIIKYAYTMYGYILLYHLSLINYISDDVLELIHKFRDDIMYYSIKHENTIPINVSINPHNITSDMLSQKYSKIMCVIVYCMQCDKYDVDEIMDYMYNKYGCRDSIENISKYYQYDRFEI